MGYFDIESGKFYSKGKLVQVIYKGTIIEKDEMTPGEWKRMLADKDSFFGRIFGW